VRLDHYRSCTWREKRDVLDLFWRTQSNPSELIVKSALEYGYYAIICLEIALAEIAIIAVAAVGHGSTLAWWALVAEALVMFATWWAVVRYRALKVVDATSLS
jgi:hypothetical protein